MEPDEGPFDAPNPLEKALMKAATDPAAQRSFMRLLIESTVYVIGWRAGTEREPVDAWNPQVFNPGDRVALPGVVRPDGASILPVYSSLRWLSACVDGEFKTLAIGARDLLHLMADETLVLDYGSPWAREFLPNEVADLVARGAGARHAVQARPREMHLGVREPEPIAVTTGVAAILVNHPRVTAAYLGTVRYIDAHAPAHLVIGLDARGDIGAAMREVAKAAHALAGEGAPVDVLQIEPGGGSVSDFLAAKGLRFYGPLLPSRTFDRRAMLEEP